MRTQNTLTIPLGQLAIVLQAFVNVFCVAWMTVQGNFLVGIPMIALQIFLWATLFIETRSSQESRQESTTIPVNLRPRESAVRPMADGLPNSTK